MTRHSADSDFGWGAILIVLLVAAFFIGMYYLYYKTRFEDCMESKHDPYLCEIYARPPS